MTNKADTLHDFVKKTFYETTDGMEKIPSELKIKLKNHPRVKGFIEQIYKQVSSDEFKKEKPTQGEIKLAVEEFTKSWVLMLKQYNEDKIMSQAAKLAVQQRQSRFDIINKAVDTGKVTTETIEALMKS